MSQNTGENIKKEGICLGYSKDIFYEAEKKIQLCKKKAIDEHEMKMKILYTRFPRAREIDLELSKTAVKVAKAVLSGSDVKKEFNFLKKQNELLRNELHEIIKKAGFPEDYEKINYSCKKCSDEGYIDGKMCTCMKEALRDEAYDRMNKLSPLSLSTFEDFSLEYYTDEPLREGLPSPRQHMRNIYNSCVRYAENFSLKSQSLLMQGATGLGKTHLSLAIANVVLNKRFGVIYGSTPNILSKLERERFRYTRAYEDSEKYLLDCDLLILDDLGTEYSTAYSSSTIYNIINSRIMTAKPTIISTNLSVRELEKIYSERLVSRIMGNHLRLRFLGSDIRQVTQK